MADELSRRRDTLPDEFCVEWASEIARTALKHLARHYVEGADLSGLEVWEERADAAAQSGDVLAYRNAMRGYVRAGLAAFRKARGAA